MYAVLGLMEELERRMNQDVIEWKEQYKVRRGGVDTPTAGMKYKMEGELEK